jgi:hypothetical protein
MAGKTFSDWAVEARKRKLNLESFEINKRQDMSRLRNSELPQLDSFDIPYTEFRKDNEALKKFLKRHRRITIRALPNGKGRQKGFTRKYEKDWSSSFRSCMKFLKAIVKGNVEDYDVGITAWEPNDYGFILISGERYIRAEIAQDVEKLSHGAETPLSSLVLDRAKVGHLEDKITWLIREEESAKVLLKAIQAIKAPFDSFDPIFLEGYFEGVVTKTKTYFLDYKTNPAYLY